MADADALGVERLGDDDVALAIARDSARIAQPAHPCEAATLFVGRGALFDGACQSHANAAQRLDRVDRGSNASLLVARPPAKDATIAHFGRERISRPTGAWRDNVIVPVEVQDRAATAERADDVDARMLEAVLGYAFGRQALHVVAELAQLGGDELGARRVAVARGIHGRYANQRLGEGDHVVREAGYFGEDAALGGRHTGAAGMPWSGVAARTARTTASATTSTAACSSSSTSGEVGSRPGNDNANSVSPS